MMTLSIFLAQHEEKEKFEEEMRETQDNLEKMKSLISGEANSEHRMSLISASLNNFLLAALLQTHRPRNILIKAFYEA